MEFKVEPPVSGVGTVHKLLTFGWEPPLGIRYYLDGDPLSVGKPTSSRSDFLSSLFGSVVVAVDVGLPTPPSESLMGEVRKVDVDFLERKVGGRIGEGDVVDVDISGAAGWRAGVLTSVAALSKRLSFEVGRVFSVDYLSSETGDRFLSRVSGAAPMDVAPTDAVVAVVEVDRRVVTEAPHVFEDDLPSIVASARHLAVYGLRRQSAGAALAVTTPTLHSFLPVPPGASEMTSMDAAVEKVVRMFDFSVFEGPPEGLFMGAAALHVRAVDAAFRPYESASGRFHFSEGDVLDLEKLVKAVATSPAHVPEGVGRLAVTISKKEGVDGRFVTVVLDFFEAALSESEKAAVKAGQVAKSVLSTTSDESLLYNSLTDGEEYVAVITACAVVDPERYVDLFCNTVLEVVSKGFLTVVQAGALFSTVRRAGPEVVFGPWYRFLVDVGSYGEAYEAVFKSTSDPGVSERVEMAFVAALMGDSTLCREHADAALQLTRDYLDDSESESVIDFLPLVSLSSKLGSDDDVSEIAGEMMDFFDEDGPFKEFEDRVKEVFKMGREERLFGPESLNDMLKLFAESYEVLGRDFFGELASNFDILDDFSGFVKRRKEVFLRLDGEFSLSGKVAFCVGRALKTSLRLAGGPKSLVRRSGLIRDRAVRFFKELDLFLPTASDREEELLELELVFSLFQAATSFSVSFLVKVVSETPDFSEDMYALLDHLVTSDVLTGLIYFWFEKVDG